MTSPSVIELRSDFLAQPTEAMLDAYRAAAKGGAYGLREDPLQRELESRIAHLLGCQDALIFPTCTMANLTAVLLHAQPGDVVVTQQKAHVVTSEAGGAAAIGGVLLRSVGGEAVEAPIEEWLAAAKPSRAAAQANPTLAWIENTHNRLGGAAASPEYCRDLAAALRERTDVKLHLDGARILYAAAVFDVPPAALAEPFDTVSISLNKGLGSPIAAALAGKHDTIQRAEHIRQRLGGGIRPVAAACAAALGALGDLRHLRDDLTRATRFGARLGKIPGLAVSPVMSNLVFFDVTRGATAADALVKRCAEQGLHVNSPAPGRIRAVFCRGVTDEDVERAAIIIERAIKLQE